MNTGILNLPFADLVAAVQANCDVSDARHAREMTLCTYLLEMRELYRWEKGVAQTETLPRAEVGAWLARREARWASLEEDRYRRLPLAGEVIDPWDVATVNRALLPAGFVYGAGIGRFGKPQFFVGSLLREEWRDGLRVLVAGREHARDLSAAPAAMRGETVFLRLESLARVLWEKAETWTLKRPDDALKAALDAHGFASEPAAALERMVAAEAETLILHELGEREAGRLLGPEWERALHGFERRRAEVFMRAARDHLADCLVTLPALLDRGGAAAVHFWFASLDGMRRELFPRACAAYAEWRDGDRGRALEAVTAAGAEHWRGVCAHVLAACRGADDCERAVEALSVAADARF